MTRKEFDSIIGTLNHCAVVIVGSRTHLPAFYHFARKFKPTDSPFRKLTLPRSVLDEVQWWRQQFLLPFCGIIIKSPPLACRTSIYVDAFTSWGIGLVTDGKWNAWRLIPGWKGDSRDIGWAEMVAVELALLSLISAGHSSKHFIVHSDNQGVIGAFRAEMSRSTQQNTVLRRILTLFHELDLWFTMEWVPSEDDVADNPSRGIFPPISELLDTSFRVPFPLHSYVANTHRPSL